MPDPAGSISREAEAFLQTHTRTFLFTLARDGAPTVHPMTGVYHEGALHMNTYRKSAKAQNLLRDPRVCCLVTTGEDEAEPRTLVFQGRVEILPPDSRFPPRSSGTRRSLIAGVSEGTTQRTAERIQSGKRIVFRVLPEKVYFL